jgi:glycosyltransferase involved in cell wall biosynthesis
LVSISLCMIVKDEEKVLERCLESVSGIADEIIIVDTGSKDKTKQIAGQYTDKIFDYPWENHFARARNYSFSKAAKEYILWLDADDVIKEDDRKKFLLLKESLSKAVDAVSMNYLLAEDANGNPAYTLTRHRLVKRERDFKWHGAVHEYLEVSGHILHSEISVTHKSAKQGKSYRNLNIYEKMIKENKHLSPRDQFYYANECFDHGMYEKAILNYETFLAGGEGWIEDHIAACSKLADCYHYLNDLEKMRKWIFKSFEYGIPREEFCCRLGYDFLQQGRIEAAIYWYSEALKAAGRPEPPGIVNHACRTWLPHLQLCVCFAMQGNFQKAQQHIEQASAYIPEHPLVLHNKSYLKSVFKETQ